MIGARVTDTVEYYRKRQDTRSAVRTVRHREPDKLRWRTAVSKLTSDAGRRRGRERMRIEEPVREVVVDLPDDVLQREVVLDARRFNVDLDRGELLPIHRMGDLRRYAFLVGADMRVIERYVKLPIDFGAPIDTAACALVGRVMANHHRRRAQRLWLELPDPDGPEAQRPHHRYMAERAQHDADLARRWAALASRLLGT
ncbi:MAG TPA: hypothetical protein RMH85_17910 [Polyangiaceae bacterium LLY-WYZ-15_(1-7)]|nr:hypothetical protein [Myxococcales bacterium]HJK92975.1 hypothetical protein [Polyangiaceae bacterium LLY-WYZ-15_(1-7)]HJL05128.1 hypothetical protein [Polyangiaceae bacterium LLY-WYZ-15_(1-7)]HJL10381.1 hypothetical protein [Polyangiaceae bacterium LLY-WYZ-15_(1-7)]HJL27814.1 hypothetical protein [Polyangiaceae bacterium LLY-WYZ-15_(1-7)]